MTGVETAKALIVEAGALRAVTDLAAQDGTTDHPCSQDDTIFDCLPPQKDTYAVHLYRLERERYASVQRMLGTHPYVPISWPVVMRPFMDKVYEFRDSHSGQSMKPKVANEWAKLTYKARFELGLSRPTAPTCHEDFHDLDLGGDKLVLLTDDRLTIRYFISQEDESSGVLLRQRDLRGPLLYLPKGHKISVEQRTNLSAFSVFSESVRLLEPEPYLPVPHIPNYEPA